MILGKNMLKEYYQDIDEEQYQPNGIDLKLKGVEMFDSEQDTIGIRRPDRLRRLVRIQGQFPVEATTTICAARMCFRAGYAILIEP